jgi:hypothetical protein
MSEQSYDPELKALEAALYGLAPSAGTLSSELVMFHAGQARARGRRWLWQVAAVLMAFVATGFGVAWYLQPAPVPVEHVVIVVKEVPVSVTTPPMPEPSSPPSPMPLPLTFDQQPEHFDYLKSRNLALQLGVDALPLPPGERPSKKTDDFEKELQAAQRRSSFGILGGPKKTGTGPIKSQILSQFF